MILVRQLDAEFTSQQVDYAVVKVNGTYIDKHGNYIKKNYHGIYLEDRITGKHQYITDSHGKFLEEEFKHLPQAKELEQTPHAHIPITDYIKMDNPWKTKR